VGIETGADLHKLFARANQAEAGFGDEFHGKRMKVGSRGAYSS
jgi:hypothetical protein